MQYAIKDLTGTYFLQEMLSTTVQSGDTPGDGNDDGPGGGGGSDDGLSLIHI